MPLSKVKSAKQSARLKARIAEWDRVPASTKVGKSGKPAFTKPGSNRK